MNDRQQSTFDFDVCRGHHHNAPSSVLTYVNCIEPWKDVLKDLQHLLRVVQL